MLAFGIRRASRDRKRDFPSCGACGYDVRETIGRSSLCPECGAGLGDVGVLPPGRGSRMWVPVLWVVVFLLAIIVAIGLTLSMLASARREALLQMQLATAAQAQVTQQLNAVRTLPPTRTSTVPSARERALAAEIDGLRAKLIEAERRASSIDAP